MWYTPSHNITLWRCLQNGKLGHNLKGRIDKMEIVSSLCANCKLCTKIVQEQHDVSIMGHYGERTTRVVVRK
jgi:hypothetical protein